MRTCSHCRLVSPDSALVCECGVPFDARDSALASPPSPARPRTENLRGPGIFVKIVVYTFGFFAGGMPFSILAVYLERQGRPTTSLNAAILGGGITGLWLARRLLKKYD